MQNNRIKRTPMNYFRYILLFSTIAVAVGAGYCQRSSCNINRDWKFYRGENVNAFDILCDDSLWQNVHLPHDFQISQPWVEPSAEELPVGNIRKLYEGDVTVILRSDIVPGNVALKVSSKNRLKPIKLNLKLNNICSLNS